VRICSSPAEYRRPPEFWTVQATFGKTGFEVADESGLTITAQVWDFLILSDALPGIEPEPGDVIAANGGVMRRDAIPASFHVLLRAIPQPPQQAGNVPRCHRHGFLIKIPHAGV